MSGLQGWSSTASRARTHSDCSSLKQKVPKQQQLPTSSAATTSLELIGAAARKNSLALEATTSDTDSSQPSIRSRFRNSPSPIVITKLKTAAELLEECLSKRNTRKHGQLLYAKISTYDSLSLQYDGIQDCSEHVMPLINNHPVERKIPVTDIKKRKDESNLGQKTASLATQPSPNESTCSSVELTDQQAKDSSSMDASWKSKSQSVSHGARAKHRVTSGLPEQLPNALGVLSLSALNSLPFTVTSPSRSQTLHTRTASVDVKSASGPVAAPKAARCPSSEPSNSRRLSEDEPRGIRTRFLEGSWFQKPKKFFKSSK